MKLNLTNFFSKLLLLLAFTSCVSITEEIYLNADGSGQYMVYSDVVMSSKGMMMGMMQGMYPDASEDSLEQIVNDQIWQQFPDKVDSLIDFSSRVPDSVKNDPESQKYLKRVEMFMEGGREKGYLNSGVRFAFKSMLDLEEFQEFLDKNQGAGNRGMDLPQTKIKYNFDGKTFSRTTKLVNGETAMNDSTQQALSAILKDAKWKLIVHLPQNVTFASPEQLIKKEGKDLYYEYDLMKVLIGEQSTDIRAEF